MNEFWVLMIILVGALVVVGFGISGAKKDCEERGGWYTSIGGYPACLPPGTTVVKP